MRPGFGEWAELRREVLEDSQSRSAYRWWTRKYGLPPTDDRFLGLTERELYTEILEDLVTERRGLVDDLKNGDPKMRKQVSDRLRVLNHIIDDTPLKDEFEDALERGQRPPWPGPKLGAEVKSEGSNGGH